MKRLPGNPLYKTPSFGVITSILLVISIVTVIWFVGHEKGNDEPVLSRPANLIKADQYDYDVKVSKEETVHAIELFKEKKYQQAIDELIKAINICPINTSAYRLLTHAYLVSGQEMKMYQVLNLAGGSFADFDKIVSVIDDEDLNNIPLDEPQDNIYLANFPENKKMAISFMFDDAGASNIYNHLDIFEKYGYKATIPVVAGFVGTSPYWGSWKQWVDAANRGFEIADHSMFHRDVKKLKGKDLDVAIDQADSLIEKKIGREVTAYVFPGDSHSDEDVFRALRIDEVVRSFKFLRRYYKRTIGIVYGGPFFSIDTANRVVDIGIERRLWILAKCHGITTKVLDRGFKSISPAVLEEHLSYIHSKSNDIYVDTFSHIFEYQQLLQKTSIKLKDYSARSASFLLLSDSPGTKLSRPLTVVLKAQQVAIASAQFSNGHNFKNLGL